MAFYWLMSALFATEAEGTTEGENTFKSTKTRDGRHVCAYNSVTEFPQLFLNRRLTIVNLSAEDFPDPPALPLT